MSTLKTRLPIKFAKTTAALRRAVGCCIVTLPYPPSTRAMFRKHNGSYMSAEYRAWRDAAHLELNKQDAWRVPGRVSIEVKVVAPDKRKRDLDNVAFKGVIDLLVKEGIIDADDNRHVRKITAEWADDGPPCWVRVMEC